LETTKRISTELRPPELDFLGLADTIRSEVARFSVRTRLRCTVEQLVEEPVLTNDAALTMVRILQEVLRNVQRHAQATEVIIASFILEGEFVLRIADNGRGISSEEVRDPGSLGVLGMKERAQRVGGRVEFRGQQGAGTWVTITIPVAQ
jgi:signal transduction histidine kinase